MPWYDRFAFDANNAPLDAILVISTSCFYSKEVLISDTASWEFNWLYPNGARRTYAVNVPHIPNTKSELRYFENVAYREILRVLVTLKSEIPERPKFAHDTASWPYPGNPYS
jgi:hypothetical protein